MTLSGPILRRSAAIGIFLAVIVFPIGGVVACGGAWLVAYSQGIYETTSLAQEYEQVIAEAPARRQAIAAMQHDLATARAFYDDSTSERASASMAQSLRDIVQQSGGDLRSVSVDPTLPLVSLEKLQVGLDLTVPSSRLPRLLSSLQAMRPFIFVSSLTISSAQYSSVEGQLWVTMKVSAFRKIHRATN